jgi:alanyl aminopeptidase
MPLLQALAASALLAAAVPSADSFPPPELRLPAGVRPLRQSVELTLDPDREPYSGTIEVDLEIGRETPVVWLNATGLRVTSATLGSAASAAPARVVPGGDDFVGFVPDRALAPGRAVLRASFTGTVSRTDSEGIFAMQEAGLWYVFSQFEAISARRAFPCFDEPAYKIPWQVSLRVPAGQPAFSNTKETSRATEDDRDLVRFAPTHPLPSYLVAVAVGPFDTVDVGKVGRNRVPARLVVPKGRGADTAWARETTPRILALLEDYFDRPYPYEKLDQVAIPGVGYAMEHPGLVTYGMGLVVQREKEQTIFQRRGWVSVAAHELAHQWFGDLVTMAWWDDTWLNESFASWMGEKVTDRFAPEWGIALDRVVDRSEALAADSLRSARRIRQPIVAKRDIEDAFDGITYGKGEAVLEMVEAWLGEDTFRRAVQAYLGRHAWGNATVSDFSAALDAAAGRDVTPVLASFLDQTGAPVLSAEAVCDGSPRLHLRQRPYRALGSTVETKTWRVPVCVRAAGRPAPACTLLAASDGEVALGAGGCPDWSYANAGGTGYYRTLLTADEARRALDAAGLAPAERVALATEMGALVASGDLAAADALSLVPRLGADPERRVVAAAAGLVSDLESVVDDAHLDRYRAFVRSVFAPRARAAGLAPREGESDDARLLRRSLVGAAGGVGADPELQKEALALTRRWLDDPSAIDPDILPRVLSIAAATGDRPVFDRLRAGALGEKDRQRRERFLSAVGEVRDPALAREAMALTLDERLDARESVYVLFGLSRHRATRQATLDFVESHFDALVARLPRGMMSPAAYLPMLGEGLCSAAERREVESFFAPRLPQIEASPRVLAQSLERIDQCVARREAEQAAVSAFLDASGARAPAAAPR